MMNPSDKVLDKVDLNRLCALEDEQLEKVGEYIRDKHKENLVEFRKSFYSLVCEISEKFMTLAHAKELYKLSCKDFVSNYDIGIEFAKRYGKKKLYFLRIGHRFHNEYDFLGLLKIEHDIYGILNTGKMGYREYDYLGWALCVSASRRIKKKPEGWANEPRHLDDNVTNAEDKGDV